MALQQAKQFNIYVVGVQGRLLFFGIVIFLLKQIKVQKRCMTS